MTSGEKIVFLYIIFGFPLAILPIRGIAISRELERMPTLKEICLGAALNTKAAKSLRRGCLLLWGLALFMLIVFLHASATSEIATADAHHNEQRSAASALFGMTSCFLLVFSFHLRQIFFNGLCRPSYLRELKEKGKQPNNIEENSLFFKEFGFFLNFNGREKKIVSYLTIAGMLSAVLSVFS